MNELINFFIDLQPSVSVGNVGQLATDLLVTKLKPKKIGMIWHSAIMPLVGGDPYDFSQSDITTSAEGKLSYETLNNLLFGMENIKIKNRKLRRNNMM